MTGALQFVAAGGAAVAAGAVNALAGGGTLITFPVLMGLGFPAVAANVTSTLALCPGYLGAALAQRRDLSGQRRRIVIALPGALAGGALGGLLLLDSGERSFRALVPFLILLASGLLALQSPLREWLERRVADGAPGAAPGAAASGAPRRSSRWAVLPLGLAAVYGGYFGAGMSVIVLAVLGLFVDDSLTRLNALKQAIALAINVGAAVLFAFEGPVDWPATAVMAAGALVGGAAGGRLASRVEAATLRRVVVLLGVVVAVVYLLRS